LSSDSSVLTSTVSAEDITSTIPLSRRTGAEASSPVYAVTMEAGDINSTCTLHSAGTGEAAAIVLSSDSSVLASTVSAEDCKC